MLLAIQLRRLLPRICSNECDCGHSTAILRARATLDPIAVYQLECWPSFHTDQTCSCLLIPKRFVASSWTIRHKMIRCSLCRLWQHETGGRDRCRPVPGCAAVPRRLPICETCAAVHSCILKIPAQHPIHQSPSDRRTVLERRNGSNLVGRRGCDADPTPEEAGHGL